MLLFNYNRVQSIINVYNRIRNINIRNYAGQQGKKTLDKEKEKEYFMCMSGSKNIRINITLSKNVLRTLDGMVKTFETSRSGMITQMVLMVDAMESNKELTVLMTKMIKGALRDT